MYRIISASKDTYITNKIINNKFRATDANLGQAGTLDLFKLYAENISGSDTTPIELSRILLKFDLTEVTSMHNDKIIDVGDSSFKAELCLHDVYGGQTTPNDFHIITFPLAKSFDEGTGYDVINYSDLDATNYITASFDGSTVVNWDLPGAMASGSLGDSDIDVIVSGTILGQSSKINLAPVQYFNTGEEDLKVDVTHFVSASVKSLMDNNGFLVAFSGSYEKDNFTYFVKRFASRNTTNETIRPKLIIKYNDTLADNHQNFEFDLSGSLYLNNFNRGSLTNVISGSAATKLTGENCMVLKIQSGSFSKQFDVSQAQRGTSKKATLTISVAGNPANDQTFTLEDSIANKTTFTFNTENNIVSAGSRNIGIASALDNNATIATRIQDAINNDSINVTAAASSTNVVLTQDFAGELGNTTLDLSGVTNVALSSGDGFVGGSYDGLTGIYSASFAISSFDSILYDHVLVSGSIEFDEIWSNHKETVTYLSSSLTISKNNISAISFRENRYLVSMINLKQRYRQDEYSRLRVFIENADRNIVFVKTPVEKMSEIFSNVYYRVRDFESGNILVPFDTTSNATKLSSDNTGMYFDFYMSSLPRGRSYVFDFMIKQNGFDVIVKDAASKFIIE